MGNENEDKKDETGAPADPVAEHRLETARMLAAILRGQPQPSGPENLARQRAAGMLALLTGNRNAQPAEEKRRTPVSKGSELDRIALSLGRTAKALEKIASTLSSVVITITSSHTGKGDKAVHVYDPNHD